VSELVIGVDIGGTKTAILVTGPDDAVRVRTVAPTPVGAPERAADAIGTLVEAALREADAEPRDVVAMGIGVPGRVDPERGHVTLAVNLGWHDLPLGPRLQDRLGIPTVVENDARSAALGLHRRHVFGQTDSLALLAIGTGIAAGVVLNGRLHRGELGLAGEIGHVVFDPNGPRCACGNTGCFEAVAAGPGIVARARAGWAGRADEKELTGAEGVFAAAAASDPVATEAIESAGRAIAWGIHLLALAYDPERIVLSGGISQAGEQLMTPVRPELHPYRSVSALAAEVCPPDPVRLLPAGSDAAPWGAVTIARTLLAAEAM
jgi:glucokinase